MVAIIVALVALKLTSSSSVPKTAAVGTGSVPASPAVVAKLTSVPVATLAGLASAGLVTQPTPISGAALTSAGKPEVLYIGAEYCPFCAAERWPVVLALSKFGTWSDLGATHSASRDVYPNTATFSFYGATFTSPYLTFAGVETTTNQPQGPNAYKPLQTPTPTQEHLFQSDNPQGSIPFVDFGGRWTIIGAS
ncbi:MAG: DUF929 family protein, partial [Acidimicrobiales bacterium]